MSEQSHFSASTAQPDAKRRKLDPDVPEAHQSKSDKTKDKGVDKAKANYLSSQLRLRLQYAKLKVEHGWQRQSLSEVENLYFRHTHLTRPYPVISPGGRRSGRSISNNGSSSSTSQTPANTSVVRQTVEDISYSSPAMTASNGSGLRTSGSLGGTSSIASVDTTLSSSVPSTPDIDGRRTVPHAPHIGSNSVTRYPVSRSDSTATIIIDSLPPLGQPAPPSHAKADPSRAQNYSSASPSSQLSDPQPNGPSNASIATREPFDPMQPTEHIDSQLAALRSMVAATSSTPIPLPPPQTAAVPASPSFPSPAPASSNNAGTGLTYDAFWSSHSSTTAYRSLLGGQCGSGTTGYSRSPIALQARASAPATLAHASRTPAASDSGTTIHNGPL